MNLPCNPKSSMISQYIKKKMGFIVAQYKQLWYIVMSHIAIVFNVMRHFIMSHKIFTVVF